MFGLGIPEIAVVGGVAMLLCGPALIKRFFSGVRTAAKEMRGIKAALAEESNGQDGTKTVL